MQKSHVTNYFATRVKFSTTDITDAMISIVYRQYRSLMLQTILLQESNLIPSILLMQIIAVMSSHTHDFYV